MFYRVVSTAILAAILAAILDLQVTCMLGMVFGGFIGLVMVENMYLDTKIMTLSSLLRKLQLFWGHFQHARQPF